MNTSLSRDPLPIRLRLVRLLTNFGLACGGCRTLTQNSVFTNNISVTLRSLAKALADSGHVQAGLAKLAEALAIVEQTGERHWEAELLRLKAEFLAAQADEAEAESSLMKAIAVSRRQQAKSWELRVAIDLTRLWRRQGKTDEARLMLAEIYNRFTEGFDTPDLNEAKALLDELS